MSHWMDELPPSPVDAVAEDERKRRSLNKIDTIFPDNGQHRRELYPKHMEYFRAGRYYRSRLFSAGNRVGKTVSGAFEATCHLTGNYPRWWPGRRFENAIISWACGTSNEKTKGIVQAELLGRLEKDDNVGSDHIGLGTGMIPGHLIASVEFHPHDRTATRSSGDKEPAPLSNARRTESRSRRQSPISAKSRSSRDAASSFVRRSRNAGSSVGIPRASRSRNSNGSSDSRSAGITSKTISRPSSESMRNADFSRWRELCALTPRSPRADGCSRSRYSRRAAPSRRAPDRRSPGR